jgi:exosortase
VPAGFLGPAAYSHILIVPFVSIFLVFIEREKLFRILGRSVSPAAALFFAGILLGALGWRAAGIFSGSGSLELLILGFLCLIWAGFLFFYGTQAFAAGIFPLLFLLLMVPVPSYLLDRFIVWLQIGSANVAEWFFRLSGTPVLPSVSIEVAKECSGIRSTQALLITCLLAGHLFLRTNWRRTALLIAAVPVLIIKNGIRIATLTLLAVHVDPSFLTGRLHHDGGFIFFILGMLILLPLFLWFQRSEAALLRQSNFVARDTSPDAPQG